MKVHCFFERSGTFKNAFIKFGHQAFDYDLLNDFGQTDYQIDLFDEIEKAFVGIPSLFNEIDKEDLIFAFFPCTRFSLQCQFLFHCTSKGLSTLSDSDKIRKVMGYHSELANLYGLFCKLYLICLDRGIRLIIENPYATVHYLSMFFPIRASLIDFDRRLRGDDFKKPTQFWFVNFEPKVQFVPEAYSFGGGKTIVGVSNKVERSLITSAYAERFIKEFIL